jgi:hypothetical protein
MRTTGVSLLKGKQMATVVLNVLTKTEVFPEGTVLGGYVYTVNGVAQPVSQSLAATFLDVAPGAGTASAQAVGADGVTPVGVAATNTFTVPTPVSLLVPDTVSVTVS